MIFGVSPRARVGGWVAVLSENKAISASKLKLKLRLSLAKNFEDKRFWVPKIILFPNVTKKNTFTII